MKKYSVLLMLFSSIAINHSAQAVDATMSFSGELVNAPCVINNNGAINVPFGYVVTTQVDGTYKKQLVNYTLTCTATVPITMKISGAPSLFTYAGTLQTSVSDLGIQLLEGTTPINLNTAWTFNPTAKPVLYAVPVKRSGSTLSAQAFTASATMTVDYP
ncbi:fimbrial protein [Serratia aquatilis]|uniref:Fimbrial protein n=1 Tax=Serratia aquatilis TaxID=1737515 RepID=A0ABV6EIJ7_9GAMM